MFLEKARNALLSDKIYEFPLKSSNAGIDNVKDLSKIWNYRLYHSPNDKFVRKGDILHKRNSETLFLVLTSDCHLQRFWKNNLGYITLIPMHPIENSDITKRIKDYINN
ncbi:MAG: hypothetical protein RQ875_14590, partial [Vicingaceae bacterium]|nr:hypothetical protein [Vicingaceae bacterium]